MGSIGIDRPHQKAKESQESIPEKMSTLSEKLKEKLKNALLTGDLEGIANAIAAIRESDHTLAEALQKYCDRFEYQKILSWIST